MYCPYKNPETGKEYTYDYVCCNDDNNKDYILCPIADKCNKEFQECIMEEED